MATCHHCFASQFCSLPASFPFHFPIHGTRRSSPPTLISTLDILRRCSKHNSSCILIFQRHWPSPAQQHRPLICRSAMQQQPPECQGSDCKGGNTANPDLRLDLLDNDKWQWNKTQRELVAYGLLFAAVPLAYLLPKVEYSGAFYFVFLALWSVYVGSHRSLQRRPPQKMSFQQGLAVPIFCSLSLFGFYCLLRFFPDLDLRTFISIYLAFVGSLAVASNLVDPVCYILPRAKSFSLKINLPQWLFQDEGHPVHATITAADCIALLAGLGSAIACKQAGAPFPLNNFVAVCIVTELLQLLSLGSVTTAAAMLFGLLLYDVFWVFGSPHVFGDNVMVMVATSTAFEGPMKFIFPQWKENAANLYSVLGLGDVAAPGLLIALMLRFDRSRSKQFEGDQRLEELAGGLPSLKPDKTYFVTCMASYLAGLTLTIVINSISGAAQPALLYLVPSLLFGIFVMASYRSEASLLLEFRDEMQVSPVTVVNDEVSD